MRKDEEIEADFYNDITKEKPKKKHDYVTTIPVNDEGIKKKGNVYQTDNNSFEADILHPNKKWVDWIEGFKNKYEGVIDETELKDGKNITIKGLHRIHPKTGERFTTQYINSYAAITWTTPKIDQFIANETRFHHHRPIKIGSKRLLNIFKQPYALDITEMLINSHTITVKEFAEKVNISEQMARNHLNKFVKLKFLTIQIYSLGSIKHYKTPLSEEKLREIMDVFIT